MFGSYKSKEEAKKLFRELALRLHPDHGGSNELMVRLQEAYERTIAFFEQREEPRSQDHSKKKYYEKEFENIRKGDDRLSILEKMENYASRHPKFNASFLFSVIDFLEEKGYITEGQYNGLTKAYYAFKMDEEVEDD